MQHRRLTFRDRAVVVFIMFMMMAAVMAEEQEDFLVPVGRLELESLSAGLLLGIHRGNGTLKFDEQEYLFSIRGIQVASLGVSKLSATGAVYKLNDIADFEGRYDNLQMGFAVIQGGGDLIMQNDKGVVIRLQTYQQGAELNLGGSSLVIALEDSEDLGELAGDGEDTDTDQSGDAEAMEEAADDKAVDEDQ